MFAEITSQLPDPNNFASIGWVGLTFFALAGGVRQVIGLFNDLKQKPSGGEVLAKVLESFALKVDLNAVKDELGERIEKVDEDLQAQKKSIIDNGDKRKASIEGKVEALRLEVKKDNEALTKVIQQTGKEVSKIEGRFDQVTITLMDLTRAVQNLQNNQGKE